MYVEVVLEQMGLGLGWNDDDLITILVTVYRFNANVCVMLFLYSTTGEQLREEVQQDRLVISQ